MATQTPEATPEESASYSVKSLIGDEHFNALPMADKEAIFLSRAKADKAFQASVPDEAERRNAFEYILAANRQSASALKNPDQSQRLRPTFTPPPEESQPPPTQHEPSGGSLLGTLGRSAVKAVDQIPGMIMRPAGVALEEYGRLPERVGLTPEGSENVFTKTGQFLQSPSATEPLETIVTGGKGFTELSPGYAALEHVLTSALDAIVPAKITANLYPLLRSGLAVPAVDQIKKAVYLAGQGATLGEVTKAIGAPGWAQFVTELVGGLASPKDAIDVINAVRKAPGLGRFIHANREEVLTKKATESFGGPNLEEQYAGGTRTAAAQQDILADFIGTEAKKVTDAEARAAQAGARQAASEARGRLLNRDLKTRVQAADDIAAQKVADVQTRVRAIEDNIAATRNDASDQARAERNALTEKRQALAEEHRQAVREAEETHNAVKDSATITNAVAEKQLTNLRTDLDRLTAASERDVTAAQDYAKKNAESLSPPERKSQSTGTKLSRARTPAERERIGRGIVSRTGETVQEFYEKVATRLRLNAENKYNALYAEHEITEEARMLRQATERFKANEVSGSVPTEQARGTYAPGSPIHDFETKLRQLASEQGMGDAPDLDRVILSLPDVQNFRSRLLEDIMHTPTTSPRHRYVSQLFNEVSAVIDTLAENNPAAFEALKEVNAWYRTEIRRLTGGPGYFARVRNPFTREYMHTPDEVARGVFGPGTSLAKGTRLAAERERSFTTYLRDLEETLQDARIPNKETGAVDTVTVAAATQARDALFDMVRAQFFDAAMPGGAYDATKASEWISQHASLLEANPTLKKLFLTARDRANTVRDVQAKAQGLAARTEANLQAMQQAVADVEARGKQAVDASTGVQAQAKLAADETQRAGQAALSKERAKLGEDVAQVSQRTREQRVQLARDRADELERIRQGPENAKVAAARRKEYQAERARLASEAEVAASANKDAAIKDFETAFPGRAAERARNDAHFASTLGATPDDIVLQIEAMGSQADKNAAWAEWMKKAGSDPDRKKAILQARWRNFLGGKDVITKPEEAAAFIKANKPWLTRYFSDYMTNIERVQTAFEAMEQLYQNKPMNFSKRSIFRHAGISGSLVYLSHIFGFNWSQAVGLGLTSEGIQHTLYRRKLGALSQIYLDPHDLDVIARATRRNVPINMVNQAAWSVLTRAGVLSAEATDETQ